MKTYLSTIILLLQVVCAYAEDSLHIEKNLSQPQRDSIYFSNILGDRGSLQPYYVSVNVQFSDYSGKLIMGENDLRHLIYKYLNIVPQSDVHKFTFQFLMNNDTLRSNNISIDLLRNMCSHVKTIPIVEEYAAKGEEAFMSYFFEPPKRASRTFLKTKVILLPNTSTIYEWLDFEAAIIQHLIDWRYYSRPLHNADGRLFCYKFEDYESLESVLEKQRKEKKEMK